MPTTSAASTRSTSPWRTTTASCPQDLSTADIIILGISRTSKTPTSIYLAQRGYKTANLPLVPGIELPPALTQPHTAFVVGLVASPERIAEIRRNRVRLLSDRNLDELRRPHADRRRDQLFAAAVRPPRLAGDRRDPPLDRGNRGNHHPAAARPPGDGQGRHAAGDRRWLRPARGSWCWPRRARSGASMLEAAGLTFRVVPAEVDEAALKRELADKSAPPAIAAGAGPRQGAGRERAPAGGAGDRRRPGAGAGNARCSTSRTILRLRARNCCGCAARRTSCRRRPRSPKAARSSGAARGCDAHHARLQRRVSRQLPGGGRRRAVPHRRRLRDRGRGIQLFERIEGDHFTIIGLPLLALLAELRARGGIAT